MFHMMYKMMDELQKAANIAVNMTPAEMKELLSGCGLPVVFILGGPGSGKGTQCEKIKKKYGFTHLSSGDLLRAEVASGSELGKECNEIMESGGLVPLETVLRLIREAMVNNLAGSKGFLIDGYPREVDQAVQFEAQVCSCHLVLYFDVPDDVMTERLLKRGKSSGRVDDNEETIKTRLETFHKATTPLVNHYSGKCITINGNRDKDEIFNEAKTHVEKCVAECAQAQATATAAAE